MVYNTFILKLRIKRMNKQNPQTRKSSSFADTPQIQTPKLRTTPSIPDLNSQIIIQSQSIAAISPPAPPPTQGPAQSQSQTNSSVPQSATQKNVVIQQLFNFSQLKTEKHFQKTVKEIARLMGEFDKFTDNLEAKVDNLLVAQQNQFITSYKRHMKKVQAQYRALQKQVQNQKEQIKYYQNQGKMSSLIKKVAMLQDQSKRLYAIIDKKQKQAKSLHLQIKVQKDQYKRLYGQYRQLVKNRNQQQVSRDNLQKNKFTIVQQKSRIQQKSQTPSLSEDVRFFTTQLNDRKSIKKDLSMTTDQNNKKIGGFTTNFSEETILYAQNSQESTYGKQTKKQNIKLNINDNLRTQLANLSLKHRKLAKINSKILQSQNQLQNLFINSVAEIKRQITIKRKIKQCSFQDFKKQDKINLLLTIISNDQILKYVYQKIFKNDITQSSNNYNEMQDNNPSSVAMKKQFSSVLGPTRGYSSPANSEIRQKHYLSKLPAV